MIPQRLCMFIFQFWQEISRIKKKMIDEVYAENCSGSNICYEWFETFITGEFDLKNFLTGEFDLKKE